MSAPASPACHAVVTGGGRGIGFAVAQALSARGARVSIIGREEGRLAAAAERLGAASLWAVADVTDEGALASAIANLVERGGRIDILVNNAGGADSKPLKRMTGDDFRRMFELNLVSAATGLRAVLPGMLEAGMGRIVNVASTAGLKGYAYVAHYCAAKHALVGFTRAAAAELARTGITVNAVCPGYTATDLYAASLANIVDKTGKSTEEAEADLLAANPQGRPVKPEEVADAVAWLCGPDAGAVTGQAIAIAGGEI